MKRANLYQLGVLVIVLFFVVPKPAQAIFVGRLPSFDAEVRFTDFVTTDGETLSADTISPGEAFLVRVYYSEELWRYPDYITVCFEKDSDEQCWERTEFTKDFQFGITLDLGGDGIVLEEVGDYEYYIEVGEHRSGPFGDFTYTTDRRSLHVGQAGNSNVAFIPGIQGSRLYRDDGGENELWVPFTNEDVRQLYMNEHGVSVNSDIYTRDIIDEAYTLNVYKDFIEFMDDEMVGGGVINEWRPLPYDWRMSVEDVAEQSNMKEQILELAQSSANGTVTLVAHSNGGLVGKILLTDPEVSEVVDTFIMVATPQLGTPKALPSLLHGDYQNLGHGFFTTKRVARELGENMPGAYGLLPTENYFAAVADPVVRFTDEVKEIYDFRRLYGESIDSYDEFAQFLTGDGGGRVEPEAGDTDAPNVLNEVLLASEGSLHRNVLDSWTAPESVDVIQIAGWGLDTVYGVEYDNCDFCPFGQDLSNLDRDAVDTVDGDGTVVTPSAFQGNYQSYFVNLRKGNRAIFTNYDHVSIMESNSIHSFLRQVLAGDEIELPLYFSTVKPDSSAVDGYHLEMKSPVAVHVYDGEGRHTGRIENPNTDSDIRLYEEEIPNSGYRELGEKKYVSLDDGDVYTVELNGEDSGTFTFDIDTVSGDEVVDTVSFAHVPVTDDMQGELILDPTADNQPKLSIDVDGDGTIDARVASGEQLPTEDAIAVLQQAIEEIESSRVVRMMLRIRVRILHKFVSRGFDRPVPHMLDRIDEFIDRAVERRRGLSEDEALPLREMIAVIKGTM